jgi:hypothetical protein
MSTKQHALRTLMMFLVLGVVAVAPVYAGSAVIGSVAGSLNATVGGQALAPNTVIFSGDSLAVRDGAAIIALENGNRMAFGRDTEASFLRDTSAVEVLLGRGDVSMYQADNRTALRVKAGDYEIAPASGYKTLGEVAMLNGLVTVTSKEGSLKVNGAGQTIEVAQGKTVTLGTKSARAPMPQTGGAQKLGGGNGWSIAAFAAGTTAAILAGISIGRADDAKTAANNATSAATSAGSEAASATAAANSATVAAENAGAAANAAGCALNALNDEAGHPNPSPYIPPPGFSCGLAINPL